MSGFPNPGDASGHRRGPCMAPVGVEAAAQMVEREDAGNVLLDLFEHQVRALLAAGLEVQVRARVARLLPQATPAFAGAGYPPTAWGPEHDGVLSPATAPPTAGAPVVPTPASGSRPASWSGDPGVAGGVPGDRQADKHDRALSFTAVLVALAISERRRLTAAEHDLVSRCKGWIRREMESLRA